MIRDDWSRKTISPRRPTPAKVKITYPSPGLCRFAGMLSFLAVAFGIYYGGLEVFGLERLNFAAPVWTVKHLGLVVAALLLAMLAGLLGFAAAMLIDVRNERLNYLFTVLWQFLANGGMTWAATIGFAMSFSLGREEAKAAVLRFGAEHATAHVVGTASVVGLVLGAAYFIGPLIRLPFILYLGFAAAVSLFAARWHYQVYAIQGMGWIPAGIVFVALVLLFTPAMIARDRTQQRLAREQTL